MLFDWWLLDYSSLELFLKFRKMSEPFYNLNEVPQTSLSVWNPSYESTVSLKGDEEVIEIP